MKANNYSDIKDYWALYHCQDTFMHLDHELALKYYKYQKSLKEKKTLFSLIELVRMKTHKNGGEIVTFTFNNLSKINSFLGV